MNQDEIVFADYLNTSYKILSVPSGKLVENSIFISLPDSLDGKLITGVFSYIIFLTDSMTVEKSELRIANTGDSVNNIHLNYMKYDPDKRFASKENEMVKRYSNYFKAQIQKFKFYSVSFYPESNKVYCKFLVNIPSNE